MVTKDPDWQVNIDDFGIRKSPERDMTVLRTISGTPYIIAPEIMV